MRHLHRAKIDSLKGEKAVVLLTLHMYSLANWIQNLPTLCSGTGHILHIKTVFQLVEPTGGGEAV